MRPKEKGLQRNNYTSELRLQKATLEAKNHFELKAKSQQTDSGPNLKQSMNYFGKRERRKRNTKLIF
uniref:Uncharacterized protein n=1 Tax=Rhizophora mucronata TaxID=61149 RepID=A0A2P2QT95_RHIMU